MRSLQILEALLWIDLVAYFVAGFLFGSTLLWAAFPKDREPNLTSMLFRGLLTTGAAGLIVTIALLVRLNVRGLPDWLDEVLLYSIAVKIGILPVILSYFGWRLRRQIRGPVPNELLE